MQVDLSGGHDGMVQINGAWATASWLELSSPVSPPPASRTQDDFDGDGKADIAWYTGKDIVGMLHTGSALLSNFQVLAGPSIGGGQIDPPVWAGPGAFPMTLTSPSLTSSDHATLVSGLQGSFAVATSGTRVSWKLRAGSSGMLKSQVLPVSMQSGTGGMG